jgi:twinfilin-like protein
MALNSGIKCNSDLLDTVSLNNDFAYIVKIKDEEFILESSVKETSSLQESIENLKLDNTCYVVIKKENVLITFIPDNENVRQKMLYASSKGLLCKELGVQGFKWDISSPKELSYDGYLQLFKKDLAFTEKELEQQKVKNDLALVDTSSNSRQGHIVSLQFQNSSDLLKELEKLKERGVGGVVFKLGENDVLELETTSDSKDIKEFSNGFKNSSPRFGYYLDGKNKGMSVYLYKCFCIFVQIQLQSRKR